MPHFTALHRYCVFYMLKVCGNLVSSKSIVTIFQSKTQTCFVSLVLYFGNSCDISNLFIIIVFVMMICDL